MIRASTLPPNRYATARRQVEVEFETPAQLAHALHSDKEPWEIVLEGQVIHMDIGEQVRVSVEVRGHTPHLLRGVVMWRRVSKRPGLPPAIGVRIDPLDADQVSRLRAIALGQFEDDVRDVLRWRTNAPRRCA